MHPSNHAVVVVVSYSVQEIIPHHFCASLHNTYNPKEIENELDSWQIDNIANTSLGFLTYLHLSPMELYCCL